MTKFKKIFILFFSIFTSLSLFSCGGTASTSNNKNYTVTWKDYDDTILKVDNNIPEGSMPSYNENVPTRQDDEQFRYTFSKWVPELAPVTQDTVYKATYTKTLIKAKIVFDLNGGSSPSYVSTKYVDSIKKENFFFDVIKENYNFRGWDYNGTKVFDNKGNQLVNLELKEEMIFTALFSQTVELNVNMSIENAGIVTGGGEYSYNSIVDLSVKPFDGYIFIGWFYENTLLSNETEYKYKISNIDIDIEARFKLESYLFEIESYNKNLGFVKIENISKNYVNYVMQKFDYTTQISISAYSSTIENQFLGWFDENNVLVDENLNYTFSMPNHDYKLYAKWDLFTIDLSSNIPEAAKITGSGNYKSGSNVTLSIVLNIGYSFDGWYDKKTGFLVSKECTISFTMPTLNLSYIARFNVNDYIVTVISNDINKGTVTGGGTYAYGSSVTIKATNITETDPLSFKKTVFSGWYDGENCISTSETYTFEMPPHDVTYIAKFNIVDKSTGDTLLFGCYPQSLVTEENIINDLKTKVGALPSSDDPLNWIPYNWYMDNSNTTKYSWYIDLDINNDGSNDYRGVYFTSYRPNSTNKTSIIENSNQYHNGYYISTLYFFKYEPIEWKVLQSTDGDFFIMSNKIIDAHQYSTYNSIDLQTKSDYEGNTSEVYPNNYKYSDLRTFLNVDFYNSAFNLEESNKIQLSIVDNSDETTFYIDNMYACENTKDKVFVLSCSEAVNPLYGFSKNSNFADPFRTLKVTDYATCMGCSKVSGSKFSGCGYWWLRSPSWKYSDSVWTVFPEGLLIDEINVLTIEFGLVPALHLK